MRVVVLHPVHVCIMGSCTAFARHKTGTLTWPMPRVLKLSTMDWRSSTLVPPSMRTLRQLQTAHYVACTTSMSHAPSHYVACYARVCASRVRIAQL